MRRTGISMDADRDRLRRRRPTAPKAQGSLVWLRPTTSATFDVATKGDTVVMEQR
jgi:hypothetical protein